MKIKVTTDTTNEVKVNLNNPLYESLLSEAYLQ